MFFFTVNDLVVFTITILCKNVADVLLLIKKRPPPTAPKMADVSTEEKVNLIL